MITISNKFKRTVKVICLALVLCICLSVVMAPKAHAISEIVIVGALALTIAACAAVVIIAAEPMGLKDTIVSAAQHGFQTPNEFVASLLARYGASQGLQQFVLMDKFQKGVFLTATGKVILDSAISNFLTDFYDWAWNDTLMDFAATPLPPDQTVDISQVAGLIGISGTYNIMYSGNYLELPVNSPSSIYSTEGVFATFNYTRAGFRKAYSFAFSDSGPFAVNRYDIYNAEDYSYTGTKTVTRIVNGTSYTFWFGGQTHVYTNGYVSGLAEINSFDDQAQFNIAYAYYYGDLINTGTDVPTYNDDALVLPAPGTGSNVLDLPGALTLPAPISGTTTATNYLTAAADAITGGTGSLEYEDANGLTQSGTLEGTDTVGLTQVGAQSAELAGSIEIADSIGSPTLDNYNLDLKSFFPFCIPFDVRDMLNLIKSAPAPVSVEWTFDFGDLGTYDLEIDLQEFDALAQTLRSMELLAFCVGLALATKRLLMGS